MELRGEFPDPVTGRSPMCANDDFNAEFYDTWIDYASLVFMFVGVAMCLNRCCLPVEPKLKDGLVLANPERKKFWCYCSILTVLILLEYNGLLPQ